MIFADLINLLIHHVLSSDSDLWWSAVSAQQSDPGGRILYDSSGPSNSRFFSVPTTRRHSLRFFLSTTSTTLFGRPFCCTFLLSRIRLATTTRIRVIEKAQLVQAYWIFNSTICSGLFQWLWPIVIRPTLWQHLLLLLWLDRPTWILLITFIGTRRLVLHLAALSLATCLHPARVAWDLTGD